MPTIFFIDADLLSIKPLCDSLEKLGYKTAASTDGTEGLASIRRTMPNLIVLCVELTGTSGYSICNKLKRDPQLSQIPLLLSSSQATAETFDEHRRLKTRADAYAHKPYAIEQVVATVRQLLPSEATEATPPPAAQPEADEDQSVAEAHSDAHADDDHSAAASASPLPRARTATSPAVWGQAPVARDISASPFLRGSAEDEGPQAASGEQLHKSQHRSAPGPSDAPSLLSAEEGQTPATHARATRPLTAQPIFAQAPEPQPSENTDSGAKPSPLVQAAEGAVDFLASTQILTLSSLDVRPRRQASGSLDSAQQRFVADVLQQQESEPDDDGEAQSAAPTSPVASPDGDEDGDGEGEGEGEGAGAKDAAAAATPEAAHQNDAADAQASASAEDLDGAGAATLPTVPSTFAAQAGGEGAQAPLIALRHAAEKIEKMLATLQRDVHQAQQAQQALLAQLATLTQND